MTTGQSTERRRQQVERASREWRSALIDVSGTNRLLFFKPTAATLNLADAHAPAMAELLAGGTVRLARLFPDPVRHAAAQRACKALAAKQREATEEYGVSVAFLALGLATWHRNPDDAIAKEADVEGTGDDTVTPSYGEPRAHAARGQTQPSAPVLLRALELAVRPGSDSWELNLTGEAQLNPVLAHVLAFQGVALDEQEALDAGDDDRGDVTRIYDHVRKACADVSGFAIDPQRLLGAFSYLKQPMVADCEDIEGSPDASVGA